MRTAYKILANLVALGVVVQAAAIVFAVSGLYVWVTDGGVLDKAAMEDDSTTFTGMVGFLVHGMNGMMVIPVLALLLFVVSFFAHVPHGIAYAGGVLALVVLQVTLGILGHETPYAGMLHGINALVLFVTALRAGQIASHASAPHVASEHREHAHA